MQTCTLNGTWQLSAGHRSLESVDMQIPGTVLSGLLAAGKIKDPFYRTNEDATRALFWKDYVFTRTFDVDEELLAQQHIVLVCEGLDTLAEISINGTFLAKTDNMHRTWKFQAKKLLHPGKNEIQIVFRSVLRFIEDYPYEAHKKINYIPCGSMKGNQLLRKAHSMFGWDWGPQTIDAGIFRDIYLQGYSHARIEDIRIHQQHAKNVSVQTSITLSESVPGQKLCVELSEDGADKPLQTKLCKTNADGVAAVDFVIENPKLWWPNDYGDQPLYIVRTTLLDEDGTSLESITRRIGLRTLTISQEKDEWGNEFAFCVNGVKIFTRGGNYIPDDCLYTRITEKKLDYILESCRRAHFNCVRVWGGGYYPSDAFYDLCDERGMVVWAEIPYISEHMPGGRENTISQMRELIVQNYNHPSIVVWGVSNEITISTKDKKDMLDNHHVLNDLCHKMDPTRLTTLACYAMCGPFNRSAHITDLVGWNLYLGWYVPGFFLNDLFLRFFHLVFPNRPIGYSEYGAEGMPNLHSRRPRRGDHTEEYQAKYHEYMIKCFERHPFMWSTYVWNMFDFAADARNQGGEPGMNHKGLVTFDRKTKKDSFFLYKAYWSDEPFVHLCGSRRSDRSEDTTTIKVYTNQPVVSLYNNGELIEQKSGNHIFTFQLPMEKENKIEAVAGSVKDAMVLHHTEKENPDYKLKKEAKKSENWV